MNSMVTWTFVINVSSIYGIHDKAKDKEFELEMSWVCDESNRLHQKVTEILRRVNIFEFILCNVYYCYTVTMLLSH